MNNNELRQKLQQQRRALSEPDIQLASDAVLENLNQLPEFIQAEHIGLYYPHAGEIDTRTLWLAEITHEKKYYLPRIVLKPTPHLTFHRARFDTRLTKNQFAIPEPDPTETILTSALDVVLCPLVAHTQTCHRLGTGCGYYDRTFAFMKNNMDPEPCLIGLAYSWQCVPESALQIRPWDVDLHIIINEKTIYRRP